MSVERSDKAVGDVDEIWSFVAQDSVRSADQLVDVLTAAFFRLGDFPYMGVARSEVAPNLRALRVGNYVIFYRVVDEVVMIERVLHARIDTSRIAF